MKCSFDNLVTCESCRRLPAIFREQAFIIVGQRKSQDEKINALERLKSFGYGIELIEFQNLANILNYGAANELCKIND